MKKLLLLSFVLLSLFATNAQEGFPDHSFGNNGYINLGFNYSGSAIAFQSDGKFVAVRGITAGYALTRYNSDGTLDASFGNSGTVTIIIPNMVGGSGALVAVENNGRIVVRVQGGGPAPNTTMISLARLNNNGSLDASFGTGGVTSEVHDRPLPGEISPRPDPSISLMSIQNDGKIVVVDAIRAYRVGYDAIYRYNSDGTRDASFQSSGISFAQASSVRALVIGSDGKIILGGRAASQGSQGFVFVTRRNSNGTGDASFTNIRYPGVVTFSAAADFSAMAVQNDGKIIVALTESSGQGESRKLLRYNADGTRDLTFGNSGVLLPPFTVFKVLAQADGKIIAGGRFDQVGSNGHFLLARYNTNGTFDPTFAYGGMTAIAVAPSPIALQNMAIAANRLYVYGSGYLAAFQLPSQSQPSIAAAKMESKAITEKMRVQKLSVLALPNPATTHFTLRFEGGNSEFLQVRIMDAMGRTVEVRRNVRANNTITIGGTYRNGLYYAEVMQGSKKITVKLMKGSN